jgi:DNA polymerase-3 subunit gamma/tau
MNTNYVPLYRKYRPQSIDQIVGQEHIKKALANAIKMDRISHAYLFTGPRGTGKTSTARIFAKSLNCEKGMTITPCNECDNCKNITNSVPIDVIEIDAASNRSVNDADEIIQKVALAPLQSRYKIYIIDEVHMLTTQAFNALLKTLEEPPKNVIFILATTEVHKVLDTIKSRCQRFDFKRITTEDITKHLKYISEQEGINISDDALYYIAQNSAGGMRDSIALLDQLSVLNSEDSVISVDDINNLLGRLSFASLTSLFDSVISSNQNQALEILNSIYNEGNEPVQILYNFLDYLRNSLVLKSVQSADAGAVVQLNSEQVKILKDKLSNVEVHQLVSLIDKCANYIKELKLSQTPKLWLDVAILDLANLSENTKIADMQKRLSMLESGEGTKMVNASPYNTPPQPVNKSIQQKVEPKETKPAASETNTKEPVKPIHTEEEVLTDEVPMSKAPSGNSLKDQWAKFVANVKSPSSAILSQQALPVKISPDEIIISIKSQVWLERFAKGGEKYSSLEDAAKTLFGSPVKKILVRAPQPEDDNIRKEQEPEDEKPTPVPQPMPKVKEEIAPPEEIEEAIAEKAEIESSENNVKKSDDFNHTDEVNMVMQLFDGKLIE